MFCSSIDNSPDKPQVCRVNKTVERHTNNILFCVAGFFYYPWIHIYNFMMLKNINADNELLDKVLKFVLRLYFLRDVFYLCNQVYGFFIFIPDDGHVKVYPNIASIFMYISFFKPVSVRLSPQNLVLGRKVS